MVRKLKKKKYIYVLNDSQENYLFKTEEDILHYINKIKQILIDNKKNNMIFCLENIKAEKRNGYNYKTYMLVNEQYNSKEETIKQISLYNNNGFRAYPIL